jgi:hypothetical protein
MIAWHEWAAEPATRVTVRGWRRRCCLANGAQVAAGAGQLEAWGEFADGGAAPLLSARASGRFLTSWRFRYGGEQLTQCRMPRRRGRATVPRLIGGRPAVDRPQPSRREAGEAPRRWRSTLASTVDGTIPRLSTSNPSSG